MISLMYTTSPQINMFFEIWIYRPEWANIHAQLQHFRKKNFNHSFYKAHQANASQRLKKIL